MTTIRKSALVPHSAHEMYELVTDVESYPEFLPWCGGARIISKDGDEVVAAIDIAHSGLHKTFTTRNRLQRDKQMEMHLVEGPFKKLHGYWLFEALDDDASRIMLDLEFSFSNRLIKMVLGPVFETIASELVDQFRKRANVLYGSHV